MAPAPLTADEELLLHDALRQLAAELERLLDGGSDRADTVDLEKPIGRVSRIDAIQQQKMAQAQRRRQELRQEQVAAALCALEEGDYGLCRRCGEDIGFRRLFARPESPYCVACASALEQKRR